MTEWTEHDRGYEGWRVAAAAGVSHFFASCLVYTFAVFFKPLAAEFAWSREVVSAAYGVMALSAAVASPLVGHLVDRTVARRVIVPCMAAVGCGFASLAFLTPRLLQFYATFMLLGAAGTAISPVAYSRVVFTWFHQRRGVALGVVIAGGAFAAIVQPPAVQAMIDLVGWRTAYLFIGLAILAIGCPLAAAFIRERPSAGSRRSETAAGASSSDALRSRIFWTLIVVFFASSLAVNAAIVHLSALLTDRGVPAGRAALALSTLGAASLAGRLTTGWFLDRFPGSRVAFVLLSFAALGMWLLGTAGTFAAGALAAALIGFGMGGELDVTPYLLSRYFGLRSLSTLYGLAFGSAALAGAIGPFLLGRAFDATGSYESLIPKIAFFMFAVAILMLTLPRYEMEGSRGSP